MTSGPSRPRRPCANACGARTRAADQVCDDCAARLDGGRWVLHAGVQHWVPDGQTLASRRRYRAAVAEVLAYPTWWATPDLETGGPDDELTCARRLATLLAESDAHEHYEESA